MNHSSTEKEHEDAKSAPALSDDELVALNDSFPDGVFDPIKWSAETVAGVTAVRALLDSFRLVGKRISSVWTESHDFFNDPDPCKTARLRKLDRLRLCLSEIRRWADKVLPVDAGMKIEL